MDVLKETKRVVNNTILCSHAHCRAFQSVKAPIVLRELLAGIIVGPFALGGLYLVDGEPLVTPD
jgi:Kef-type K+ transport system membrane component KefB